MFCPKCGTQQVEKDVQYCSSCGAKLDGSSSAGSSAITTQQPPKSSGTVFVVFGWIFFAISLLFIPILFGAGSFIMGYLVRKSGRETHGTIIMVMAIAGAIFGMLLGMAAAGL